ncbi:hypothetical protein EIP91_008790 [Steccherinum ochraceum]|uniref:ZZ-type domain-containing protein n=1 Tax=Steccherinum ochraceum TaxID=92696 RepID=A0A4R0R2D0_9APHY|nr:hypothetical protein EIP91_008790 [Steccherinum ochraceum]
MAAQETTSQSSAVEDALEQASKAVGLSDNWVKTKGETRLDHLGNGIQRVATVVTMGGALSEDSTKDAFAVIKHKIDTFVEDSRMVMSVLDEIGKIHPFIQVAVSAFNVALNLELTRRGNDEKVLALKVQMKDMMCTLFLLKNIDRDDSAIAERFTTRMIDVTLSIKLCAEICEAYQRQKLVYKFFSSHNWESKFADVSTQFEDHKVALQHDLAIHTNRGVATANEALVGIQADLRRLMQMVFESFRSGEEREVSAFVASKGGPEKVLKSDVLLAELLKMQKARDGRLGKSPLPFGDERSGVDDLRRDLTKDLGRILEENRSTFEHKFDAQQVQIERVRDTVVKEGDRIINTMLSGPHERIVNRDIYSVWKENHWKTSVKAHHLVMALHDYLAQQRVITQSEALDHIRNVVKPENRDSDARKVDEVAEIANVSYTKAKDRWALEYIGVHLVRPLIEVIDEDFSSFVTISEINAFTSARPADWSLPHWIAYWTVGFESTVRWYYNRIVALQAKIWSALKDVLPANRKYTNEFNQSDAVFYYIDFILAGIQESGNIEAGQRKFSLWNRRFKSFVDHEERRLDEVLSKVCYQIDDENTLALIVGHARPEQYVLPLIFLLLRRALDLIELGSSNILDEEELSLIDTSFRTLFTAVITRMDAVEALCNLQDRNNPDQYKRLYHGMYYYLMEPDKTESIYWQTDPEVILAGTDQWELTPPDEDVEKKEYFLSYESPTPDLDHVYQQPSRPSLDDHFTSETPSLVGHWGGTCTYEDGRDSGGFVSFRIQDVPNDGVITGHGVDSGGRFHIRGSLEGTKVVFTMEYHDLQGESTSNWLYEGSVNECLEEMNGTWGLIPDDAGDPRNSDTASEQNKSEDANISGQEDGNEADVGDEAEVAEMVDDNEDDEEEEGEEEEEAFVNRGSFTFKRRPELYFLARPDATLFETNRIGALWRLGITAALHIVRGRQLRWETIRERRDRRRIYISLLLEQNKDRGRLAQDKKAQWRQIVDTTSPEDLQFWRVLGDFYAQRCEIVHLVECSNCEASSAESVRYICLECSESKVYDTLDLCQDCVGSSVSWVDDDKEEHEHLPTHNLLQIRLPLPVHFGQAVREKAKMAMAELEASAEEDSHDDSNTSDMQTSPMSTAVERVCVTCAELVTEPYWLCLDCEEARTSVCSGCNDAVTKERPWLFNYRPNSEQPMDKHNWSHNLVLLPDTSESELTLTVEDRLTNIETMFSSFAQGQTEARQEFEQSVSARMDRLEHLMTEILRAVGKPNHGRKK